MASPCRRRDLRSRMEDAIERMIAALDALDAAEEDLEDGADAESSETDEEPSLGSPELTWEHFCSQEYWSRGGAFETDAEEDASDDEDGGDTEPWLAAPEPRISDVGFTTGSGLVLVDPAMSQDFWCCGCTDDRELGDDNGVADPGGLQEIYLRLAT